MTKYSKSVNALIPSDLMEFRVWQFTLSDDPDETFVCPVRRKVIKDFAGKLIGTNVILNNGDEKVALIGNLFPYDKDLTEQLISLSIWHSERWFTLAHYGAFNYDEHGPECLAKFLDLTINDVFPIKYDVCDVTNSSAPALRGLITKLPKVVLSQDELFALYFSKRPDY